MFSMYHVAVDFLNWQMLSKFSCIALAGVSTEYLLYGMAEGGLADINKVRSIVVINGYSRLG
jgi:hypothetical protein